MKEKSGGVNKKYTVYILLSLKGKKLYTGCTSDFKNRLKRHNAGYIKATKNRVPLILLHKEDSLDKTDAFNKERFYKSLWSSRFKKKLKDDY